ncbi:MAG: 2-oxoacid:ferredoxin oxidoreductase subunit gamma, partial [Desulfobacteraceae bacterium]|nr:2-oxoacid:ferredoxin oxidoreductase subunit gamma [Desulfobacteraceae bacterium]
PGGTLLVDSKYVETKRKVDARHISLPMYEKVMEEIGKPIVFNICMLGALLGVSKIIKPESIMKVLETKIPKDFLQMNQKALDLGLKMGEESIKEK